MDGEISTAKTLLNSKDFELPQKLQQLIEITMYTNVDTVFPPAPELTPHARTHLS